MCVCLSVQVCLSRCLSVCLCIAAIISVIGVIIFGRQFYGDVGVSPFGWSFLLTIFGILIFAINGVCLILLTVYINIHVGQMRSLASGRSRTQSGIMGCLSACFGGLWDATVSVSCGCVDLESCDLLEKHASDGVDHATCTFIDCVM